MVKNEKIKRVLKSTIFPFFSLVNKIIPKFDSIVLLYSPNKGIEHNLLPLKKYLLKEGYNTKYRIICCVANSSFYENDGMEYVTIKKGFFIFFISRHVFYTTGQIPIKPSANQIVIQMDHGTTAIKTEGYLKKHNSGYNMFFSLYCAPSKAYIEIIKKEFKCNNNNIVINSEPVTDALFESVKPYEIGDYKKLGLWIPTFRQSDFLGYDDSNEEELLPTLKEDYYNEFNELLRNQGIIIIVKLHDAQSLTHYNYKKYSNLIILSGSDFLLQGYDLYELMKQSDFIIADYSSVYLQYLVLNKPIGFAIPDIEEYKTKRGFVFDPVEQYMPGAKIRNKTELYKFINDMALNVDNYEDERKKINKIVNCYTDGKSCDRLMIFSEMYT